MFEEHGFSVGLPDNLVHLPRLLEILKIKLDHLQCFYCEHIFKSTKVLKEHMRKKKHWRIPQSKPLYDQFYIVTYSSADTEHSALEDPEDEAIDGEEEEWVGWDEDDDESSADPALCIYCPSTFRSPPLCFSHMAKEHGFDFFKLKASLSLSPYQCISWLNYARQCFAAASCINCDLVLDSKSALLAHMNSEGHFHPPTDSRVFTDQSYVYHLPDQHLHHTLLHRGTDTNTTRSSFTLPISRFIIPTLEGDILLTGVDEDEESEAEEPELK